MQMRMVRQGDVLLRKVSPRPRTGRPVPQDGRLILAWGEATGHTHEVVEVPPSTAHDLPAAQFFDEPDGQRFLCVDRPCALIHPEHGTIVLAPGWYAVTRQREYTPAAIRTVAD